MFKANRIGMPCAFSVRTPAALPMPAAFAGWANNWNNGDINVMAINGTPTGEYGYVNANQTGVDVLPAVSKFGIVQSFDLRTAEQFDSYGVELEASLTMRGSRDGVVVPIFGRYSTTPASDGSIVNVAAGRWRTIGPAVGIGPFAADTRPLVHAYKEQAMVLMSTAEANYFHGFMFYDCSTTAEANTIGGIQMFASVRQLPNDSPRRYYDPTR